MLDSGKREAVRVKALQYAPAARRRVTLARLKQTGELEELEEHPFLDLMSAGNSVMTGLDVRKMTFLYRYVEGEAFWVKERDTLGTFIRAWPCPPHWIRATPTPSRRTFLVGFRGWQGEIPDTEIVWFAKQTPENPYGRGTGLARALADELETDQYSASLQRQVFVNGARPDFVVYPKNGATWTDMQIRQLEHDWRRSHEGFFRAFKARFSKTELGIQEFKEANFRNLQMEALRRFTRDTVIQVAGIPPELLGILESSNRACHSSDTECLTRRGWVSQAELTTADEIATWNDLEARVEYHHPLQIVRYPYQGPMHAWTTRSVNALVTPDHRMWVKTQYASPFQIRRSFEMIGKKLQQQWRATGGGYDGARKHVEIPYVARHYRRGVGVHTAKLTEIKVATIRARLMGGVGRVELAREYGVTKETIGYIHRGQTWQPVLPRPPLRIDSLTFASFLGYFIAEGSYENPKPDSQAFGISLHQNEGVIAEKMRAALVAIGVGPVRETRSAPTPKNRRRAVALSLRVADPSLRQWLLNEVGHRARNKRIPREAFDWPETAQVALLDAMMEGDGSAPTRRAVSSAKFVDRFYGTTSRGLADDVQHLCIQLGLRSAIRRVPQIAPHADQYIVTISSKQHVYVNTSAREANGLSSPGTVVPYEGVVWCVEVPGGLFFTRRQGKVALHGNTIESAETLFAHWVLMPELESFRATLQERVAPEFDERLIIDYAFDDVTDKAFVQAMAQVAPWSRKVDEWRSAQGLDPLGPEAGGETFPVGPALSFETDLSERDDFGALLSPANEVPPSLPLPSEETEDEEEENDDDEAERAILRRVLGSRRGRPAKRERFLR